MKTPVAGRARVLRGLVLATASLIVPAFAHVAAGGAVPVDIGFLLAGVGLAGACVALADRRRGLLEIGAVVLLTQPIMHAVLSWGGHHDVAAGGWAMVFAHVVAGVVVSGFLAGGEAVLWAWWSLWTTVLWTTTLWTAVRRHLASAVLHVRRPSIRRTEDSAAPPTSVVVGTTAAPRRGPPHLRMA